MMNNGSGRIAGLSAYLVITILVFVSAPVAAESPPAEGAQKAVLVTGASSGIGRRATEVLASNGWFVYAGARKQEDLDALNALDNVEGIRLDVTVQEEIDAAVETVANGGRGLYGLVNNAGVFTGGPLIETDVGELEWIFDVNVFGVYRVTQAFAPMIIESKGRIVNISSISGVLDWQMGGLYSMSKHAIEAYSDTLGLEMARFGVGVSAVEPGNYQSDISVSARQRMAKKALQNPDTRYADEWAGMTGSPEDRSQYKEPDEVAATILKALTVEKQQPRYLVVPDQKEAGWIISEMIKETVEMNGEQPFSYNREQLIEMLDAAMSASD